MLDSFFYSFLFFFIIHLNIGYASTLNETNIINKDSIPIYIKNSKDKSKSINERLVFVNSIYNYANETKNDSLKNEALKLYIYLHYKKNNWSLFNKFRREHIELAKKQNDSIALAKTYEYSAYYHKVNNEIDSTYYYYLKSFKIYEKVKDSLKAGKVLISIAILQKNIHDYIGSESTSFKALKFLKSGNNLRRISSIYNNLGLVYEKLNDFENSKKYHYKALELRTLKKDSIYKIHSLINLGILHTKNKKYIKALSFFEEANKFDSILQNNLIIKAFLIDSYTYARFKKGETKNIIKPFIKALKIRERLNHSKGLIVSYIHLAEYYSKNQNRNKSFFYAEKAEKVSKSIHDFYDYLKSIELLSNLQNSKKSKDEHFKRYIFVRDSLDRIARMYKEQFARIRFETNEKELLIKNQKSEIKRKSTKLLLIIFGATFIFSILSFNFIRKRIIQRKLQKKLMNGFKSYLIKKYSLSSQNFEFWETLAMGLNQKQISIKLNITIEAVKSRRRSLKKKINAIKKNDENFDKIKAIILYNNELNLFKNNLLKKNR